MAGNDLTILGQTNIWIKFKHIKKVQEIEALVCKEESAEDSINLDSIQSDVETQTNKKHGDEYMLLEDISPETSMGT